jgi:DNA topoisomerase IA
MKTPTKIDEDTRRERTPPARDERRRAFETCRYHADQHFTQPPPRYSEASLVKKLEELGIGRPSTYASILQVLRDRKYVLFDKRRFIPEDRGRLVTTFLSNFLRVMSITISRRISRKSWMLSPAAKFPGKKRCASSGWISRPPSTRRKI